MSRRLRRTAPMRIGGASRRAIIIAVGVLLLLPATAYFLLPKVINVDSVRSSIERSVSKELGGTVTFAKVGLDLFPTPRVDVRNVAIEIPGKASVSIPSAKIAARLLPLLTGRFVIGQAALDRPVAVITVPGAAAESPTPPPTKPAKRSPAEILAAVRRAAPDLSLKMTGGEISLVREGGTILKLEELDSRLAFVSPQEGQEPDGGLAAGHFQITGELEATIGGGASVPAPIKVAIGRLNADPKRLAIAEGHAQLLDLDLTAEGSVEDYLSASPKADIAGRGAIGAAAAAWMQTLAGLPADLKVRTPLQVAEARLRIAGAGPGATRELAGTVATGDGPTLSFELNQQQGLLTLKSLRVKDSASDALLTATVGERDLSLGFSGNLEGPTLLRVFEDGRLPIKSIRGDLRLRAPRGRWREATAEGTLEGEQFAPPLFTGLLTVDRFALKADGRTLALRPATLSLGPDTLTAEGTVSLTGKGLALDLDLTAQRLGLKALQDLAAAGASGGGAERQAGSSDDFSVEGKLRLRAGAVALDGYATQDVALTIALAKGRAAVRLDRASWCGISLEGELGIDGREIGLALRPHARGRGLEEDLRCVTRTNLRVTGTYDLKGTIAARGPREAFLRSLQGDFDLSAKKGRVHDSAVAAGVTQYLDKTSILKDSHQAYLKEGVPYDTIALRGSFRDATVTLAKFAIRSKDFNVTAGGDLDLRGKTMALTVLVAPLRGIDRALSKVPLVRHIAGNALVVVPVKVEGPFGKPEVKYVPASGVSTSALNLMKNIVQAPLSIIEPIVGGEGQQAPP